MEGNFQFTVGDVVLAEWTDKLFYAKILHIDGVQLMCTLLFDDDSVEECPLSKIHSVTETTADIVCIICKDGASCRPNEIVLCDKCGIGYHQRCHEPFIKDNALEPDAPWMCVYCTNGSECPHLLNPFEAKMKNFTPSSRKQRALTKDIQYNSERKVDFGNNNKSERAGMDDCYDGGNHMHPEMSTTTARHIIGDHHVMSRRAIVDQRMSGNRFHKAYKCPKTYDSSRERLHYPQMEAVAKKHPIVQHENETQDVWDNGCPSPRDTVRNPERFDGNNKGPGKEGPREKQRLTQDLERQRKKLKEDMERGEELEREHSQLLTRDHGRVQQDTTTEDIKKRDLEESRRYERTLYIRGREWSGPFRAEKLSGRNSREKSLDMDEISRGNTKLVKQRNANINKNDSLQQTRPTTGDEKLEKQEPRRKLDSCGCEGSEEHSSGSQGENRAENNLNDMNEGTKNEISETQCEHSTSNNPRTGDTNEFTYENISPPSSNARGDMVVEVREEPTQGTKENVNVVHDRVFTSEKVEVIGRSDELGSSSSHEEITKECQPAKGRTKKVQGKGRSQKRYHKSSAEKSNHENTIEGNEGENSTKEKTTEGEHNGIARTDLSREGSRGFDRRNICHGDGDIAEERKSKERTKIKSHNTAHEGSSKNDNDEVQNAITQNRVRSDLPGHNWLIERLRNEKKLPPGGGGSCDDLKEKKAASEEALVDSKLEVTAKPEDVGLKKTRLRSTTSPVLEDKAKEDDVEDGMQPNCGETSYVDDNDQRDDFEKSPSEVGSPNFKLLSPKPERNSPLDNNLSPELKRYSPTLVPASPCEDDELQKGPSPLLQVPEIPRSTLGAIGKLGESGKDNEKSVGNKTILLDNSEGSDKPTRQSVEDNNEENFEMMADEKRATEEDGNIIEITSDGEGHDDIKQTNDTISKISTGKSVNPVSPFLRSERRSMEELQTAGHGLRHHAMLPRGPRFPVDLPFMKPGYIPGYPPRTFTPHLLTHNPSGLPKPVSPIAGHTGHPSTRLDLGGHSKPDHDCPYHGKKATEKLTGYPMMHSDHHYLNRIPFHEGVPPDFALHDKLREHVQLAGDPLGFHRRLSSVYDRHFMMPHGMSSHMFPSRYLPPRLLDEHLLHLDRERFERRMFPLHEPPKHAYSGPSEEHRNAPKCVASPSEEKRDASKHIATPSAEHQNVSKHIDSPSCDSEREPTKSRPLMETTPGYYHPGYHQSVLSVSRQRSPDEVKYLKGEQFSEFNGQHKSGKRSPHPDRNAPYTSPPPPSPNKETSDYHSPFIKLDGPKTAEGKPGNEGNSLGLTRSQAPHDQGAISRDFQERLNMLNKKFIKGLEAMGKPGDERTYKAASSLHVDDKVPRGYRRPGPEFVHHGARVGHVTDGTTRPLAGDNAPPFSRQSGLAKYSNHDNQRSPTARSSSPGVHTNDRGEQDIKREASQPGLLNVSSHKPTLPMTSYRPPHGNAIGVPRAHVLHARDEMKKSPGAHGLLHLARQGDHPHHERMAWSMRPPRPLTSYPLTRINPKAHQKSTVEKSEKTSIKQELEEKEITLAREKHLINLAHLENERRKAMMNNERPRPRLPSMSDERKEEQTRPDQPEQAHHGPRAKEEALRKDWEEPELSRKRKYEEMRAQMHGGISSLEKTSSEQNKMLKRVSMDGRIPSHNTLHPHIHEDFNSRKDCYLSMYRGEPYGHVTTVAHAGRGRNVGNTPFYMGRFDLQRSKPEQSMELRKAKEVIEENIPDEKQSNEKDTTESAKKRQKTPKLCDVCRKEASFLCSGCEKAWYCSAECQFKVWTEHSKECSQSKRR